MNHSDNQDQEPAQRQSGRSHSNTPTNEAEDLGTINKEKIVEVNQ